MGEMQLTEVTFSNVVWPEGKDAPSNFKRRIRSAFITKPDGSMFEGKDLYDILHAWLTDEFNECPIDFTYYIAHANAM